MRLVGSRIRFSAGFDKNCKLIQVGWNDLNLYPGEDRFYLLMDGIFVRPGPTLEADCYLF